MPPAVAIAGVAVLGVAAAGNMYMQYQSLEEQKDARAAYEKRLEEATKLAEENAGGLLS